MRNIKLFEDFNIEESLIESILIEGITNVILTEWDNILEGLENDDMDSIDGLVDEQNIKSGQKKFMKKKKNKEAVMVKSAVAKAIKGEDSPLASVINKLKKVIKKETKRIAKEMKINPARVIQSFDKIKLDLT